MGQTCGPAAWTQHETCEPNSKEQDVSPVDAAAQSDKVSTSRVQRQKTPVNRWKATAVWRALFCVPRTGAARGGSLPVMQFGKSSFKNVDAVRQINKQVLPKGLPQNMAFCEVKTGASQQNGIRIKIHNLNAFINFT
jgi:hypothetical protein